MVKGNMRKKEIPPFVKGLLKSKKPGAKQLQVYWKKRLGLS